MSGVNVPESLVRVISAGLSASRLQNLSPPARDRTITVTAENAPIPIVYGETSLPGIVFAVGTLSGDLVVGVGWGYGRLEAIDDVYINDEALPIAGVTVTHYLGTTSQTVDSTLSSAVAAFNDDMILRTPAGNVGIAYSVFRIDPGALDGSPRFQAIVRGRRVFDPRTSTTAYSANPALCAGDLVTDPVIGMGVSLTGLGDAADWCDELLGGVVARCRIGLALTQPQRTTEYLNLMSTYAELIWYWEGSDIVFIPDRAISFDSIADASGQDALTYASDGIAETYASGDFFAEDYLTDTALVYTDWAVGAGWAFRPLIPVIGISASASVSQSIVAGGEAKYVARFSILSRTAGTVALEFNGAVVISAKSAVGSYEVIVTGNFSGTDTFELVGSSFTGVVTPIELQRTVRLEDQCIAGTLSVQGVDEGDTPTRVSVRYTNSGVSSGYWPDALTSQSLSGVDEGEVPLVESTLSLPGVTRAEEANNKALARLEQMKNRVTVSWVTSDKGIVHRKGDVIRHRMPSRGTDILVRIQSVQMISYGRYRVTGTRYDASHYPSELILPENTGLIPVGAILPLSGSTVPSGWANYTAANGRYILGAGGTYSVGATGGSSTFAGWSGSTDVKDMHAEDGGSGTLDIRQGGGTNNDGVSRYDSFEAPDTDHSHTFSIGTITPDLLRRENKLVQKTGTAATSIPKEVQTFGLPNLALSGLSRVVSSANRLLVAAASNANAGVSSKFVSGVTSSAGVNHDHMDSPANRETVLGLSTGISEYDSDVGAHTHSYNLEVNRNTKRKTLALWGSGSDFEIIPGMIVLWDNLASIPTDWVICDGTNQTPDLRDYFIEIAPLGGEDVASGNNTISVNGNTSSYYHNHNGGSLGQQGTPTFAAFHDEDARHLHTINESGSWMPPYYALGAIMFAPS